MIGAGSHGNVGGFPLGGGLPNTLASGAAPEKKPGSWHRETGQRTRITDDLGVAAGGPIGSELILSASPLVSITAIEPGRRRPRSTRSRSRSLMSAMAKD